MKPARSVLVLVVAIAGIVVAIVALFGPAQPATLPPLATPLALRTQPWQPWPPAGFSCGMAAVTPIRVKVDGNAMAFEDAASGNRLPVVWPSGFSARAFNGRAELVPPHGAVLARDGDVISGLAGGAADNGDILVCLDFGSKPNVEPSTQASSPTAIDAPRAPA